MLEFRHTHAWVPAVGAVMWFATLWAMLITWLAQDVRTVISDVGADILKPLFVVAAVITGLSFALALWIERWFRHSGRLLPNMRRREKVTSSLSVVGAIIGAAGLILLSIFDTKRHPSLHRLFLLIFMIGVTLSAIFTVFEFTWLNKTFGDTPHLKAAYATKGILVTILVGLAIPFGLLLDSKPDTSAVLEWAIAFLFTFYMLTFVFDLWHARPKNQPLMAENGDVERHRKRVVRSGGRGYAM